MATFIKGQRVLVDGNKFGTVNYQRMGAPDYTQAEAVSVILDNASAGPLNSGSIFPADKVAPLKKFRVRFFGRKSGAIGIFYNIETTVEAPSAEEVDLFLHCGRGTPKNEFGVPQAYEFGTPANLVVQEVSEP